MIDPSVRHALHKKKCYKTVPLYLKSYHPRVCRLLLRSLGIVFSIPSAITLALFLHSSLLPFSCSDPESHSRRSPPPSPLWCKPLILYREKSFSVFSPRRLASSYCHRSWTLSTVGEGPQQCTYTVERLPLPSSVVEERRFNRTSGHFTFRFYNRYDFRFIGASDDMSTTTVTPMLAQQSACGGFASSSSSRVRC